MCTKPAIAKLADSMYSRTPEILQNRIILHRRLSAESERQGSAGT